MNVMLCLVWYDWLDFGVVCSNQILILIIMLKCYLNVMLSIIFHVLFTKFFYISLFMVSLTLFVCLCVCCLCNDRITCVLYGSKW